jgi:hypothetical protein
MCRNNVVIKKTTYLISEALVLKQYCLCHQLYCIYGMMKIWRRTSTGSTEWFDMVLKIGVVSVSGILTHFID